MVRDSHPWPLTSATVSVTHVDEALCSFLVICFSGIFVATHADDIPYTRLFWSCHTHINRCYRILICGEQGLSFSALTCSTSNMHVTGRQKSNPIKSSLFFNSLRQLSWPYFPLPRQLKGRRGQGHRSEQAPSHTHISWSLHEELLYFVKPLQHNAYGEPLNKHQHAVASFIPNFSQCVGRLGAEDWGCNMHLSVRGRKDNRAFLHNWA